MKQTSIFILTFVICNWSKAQKIPTRIPNVYSLETSTKSIQNTYPLNDSLIIIEEKNVSYKKNLFLIINVNTYDTLHKIIIDQGTATSLKPLYRFQLINGDDLYFTPAQNISETSRKFPIIFRYRFSKKELEPIIVNKSIFPKSKDDLYISPEHTFIDQIKNIIYFSDFQNTFLIKYNIIENKFEELKPISYLSDYFKFIYAHNDHLYYKVSKSLYLSPEIEFKIFPVNNYDNYKIYKFKEIDYNPFIKLFKDSSFYIELDSKIFLTKGTSLNEIPNSVGIKPSIKIESNTSLYNEGLANLTLSGEKIKNDTLNFKFSIYGYQYLENNLLIILKEGEKANINYRKELANAKRIAEQKVYDERIRKEEEKRKQDEKIDASNKRYNSTQDQSNLTLTLDFSRTFNRYTTFTKSTNPDDYKKMPNQFRFKFSMNKIEKYIEKPRVVNIDWELQREYKVIRSFKKQNKGETFYEYHTAENIIFLINEGTPSVLIIQEKDSYLQYSFYL